MTPLGIVAPFLIPVGGSLQTSSSMSATTVAPLAPAPANPLA